jgi:hypothetical protein
MEILVHVPPHFNKSTFDSLSAESQCKVAALFEVAYILDVNHLKPLSPKEFYSIYDLDAHECYDTCTSLINAAVQGLIKK